MAIADIEGEQPMAIVGGTFADDDAYAIEIASKGLKAMFGDAPQKKEVVAPPVQRPLPRGLRRKRKA